MTDAIDTIWFTRCPVPTATGLAYKLGWLDAEFAPDGIKIATLQEHRQEGGRDLGRHHYDHQLPSLIREGGNLLAIAARAQGAPSKLIGLTWIDEAQAILVRPGSGITRPEDLKGKRIALPGWSEKPDAAHVRGSSIARGMSQHGIKGALAYAGLTFDDVHFVEVGQQRPAEGDDRAQLQSLWTGLPDLVEGRVDAAYVKGASAIDAAQRLGLEVGIDLDALPDRRWRVNNGTPRPITVHQDLLDNHFDLVVRFLERTLAAADWARTNQAKVREVLGGETRAGAQSVERAYSDETLADLHPDLSDERLALFEQQKTFMHVHNLLDRDFALADWVDARPLEAARARLLTKAAETV
ncbi:ABC transporter substrate-binding protein [Novosphingobium sp. P6W]|uniref:ABC transporter substrate-binding protein n=1 Tax=Novosphingobium sp. P6W TaxID=1609758 RepID=UPI0005C2A905|nr:ABC transporter substrate-binding protein [Novosphingobium sp. P6W]AXB78517.1 ABC transporter substrate-binding protein [Novosphingobium sp. P6W]KIS30599.1 monooxygenase [Novosphingobium sp. P6W]